MLLFGFFLINVMFSFRAFSRISFAFEVLKHIGDRISLTMKEVDQETGADLFPRSNVSGVAEAERDAARNPDRPINDTGLLEIGGWFC